MSTLSRLRTRLETRSLSEFLDQVTAAMEAESIEDIKGALRPGSRWWGSPVVSLLSDAITGRVSGEREHDEASSLFHQIAHTLPATVTAPALHALARLAQATGCFVASGEFFDRALRLMASSSDNQHRFVAAMVRRDLDSATSAWKGPSRGEWSADAGHYLWWWSGGLVGQPQWSTEPLMTDRVRGHQVLVLGPAPTSLSADDVPDEALVGRVIAPGVTSWPAHDALGGRCDLVWANSKSTKWFVAQNDPSVFDGFAVSSFRTEKWRGLGLAAGRTSLNHKSLLPMPWDKTNMVPLAVWDLLHVHDVDVVVAGTTFFASPTAYSAHELRFKQERAATTDQAGSTGIRLERCLSFSHHSLVGHLSMMANLAQVGAVGFDQEGKTVLELSTGAYLEQLDQFYGVPGI